MNGHYSLISSTPLAPNGYANWVVGVCFFALRFRQTAGLEKHIGGYIYFLWGMWGDSALSLIQRGFEAPHKYFFSGEIPHKCGELKRSTKGLNRWAIDRKMPKSRCFVGSLTAVCGENSHIFKACGELESRATHGLKAYLPTFPTFSRHEGGIDIIYHWYGAGQISTAQPILCVALFFRVRKLN